MFATRQQSDKCLFPIPNLSKGLSNMSKKTSDEWMDVVFDLDVIFRSGMGRHLLSKVIQNRYKDDASIVEDQTFIDMFRDRPAIDNFGYMLECTSTYDASNKKREILECQ